jgi:hypothetical protein
VQCTLQIKDVFFADVADSDEALLAQYGLTLPPTPGGASAGSAASPGSSQTSPGRANGFLNHPSAQAATLSLRAQKNMEENQRGAAARLQPLPMLQNLAWALGPTSGSGSFKPGGTGSPITTPGVIGAATPGSGSRLRKQFELARFSKLKPAHVSSRTLPPLLTKTHGLGLPADVFPQIRCI